MVVGQCKVMPARLSVNALFFSVALCPPCAVHIHESRARAHLNCDKGIATTSKVSIPGTHKVKY